MAERRMFAKSIVLSDAFLDMPATARCLYFTLSMYADDDGFIGNPKALMRQVGASEDDMKVLLSKRYVLGFESGVIVIKHWRINNYLRNDRYHNTTYIEERDTLDTDEKGAYTEKLVYHYGYTEDSIGKDSIGYINNVQKSDDFAHPDVQKSVQKSVQKAELNTEFEQLWKKYPRKRGKDRALTSYIKARKTHTYEEINKKLDEYIAYCRGKEEQYILNGSTFFGGRWQDEYGKKEDTSYNTEKVKELASKPIVYKRKN